MSLALDNFDVLVAIAFFLDLKDVQNFIWVAPSWNLAGTRYVWEHGVVNWRMLSGIGHLGRAAGSAQFTVGRILSSPLEGY